MELRAFARKFRSEYKMIAKKDFYVRSIGVIDENWVPVYCASSGMPSCKCTYHVNPPEGEFAYVRICNGKYTKTKFYFNSVLKSPLVPTQQKKLPTKTSADSSSPAETITSTESSDKVGIACGSNSLVSDPLDKSSSEISTTLSIREGETVDNEAGNDPSDNDDSSFEDYSDTEEEKTKILKTSPSKPSSNKSSKFI